MIISIDIEKAIHRNSAAVCEDDDDNGEDGITLSKLGIEIS